MKKITLTIMCFLLVLSCNTGNNIETSKPLYKVAEKYFVKNDQTVNTPTEKVITNQEEFDKIFGAAAHMGKNGTPTAIDFSKEQVIAIMLPVTNIYTKIHPINLIITKIKDAEFYYKIEYGEKLNFNIKPLALIVVSKKIQKINLKKTN